jgi:hypothetical protein
LHMAGLLAAEANFLVLRAVQGHVIFPSSFGRVVNQPAMETTTTSVSALEEFKSQGIYLIYDEAIGQKVKEVDDQGLSTKTSSWEYFRDIIGRHAVSWQCLFMIKFLTGVKACNEILEPFLQQPNPKRCHTFGPEPGQIFCFWPQPQQSRRLVVAMWSSGTEIELYHGSHLGALATVPASNGLFEASPQAVKVGHEAVSIRMESGGMYVWSLVLLHACF